MSLMSDKSYEFQPFKCMERFQNEYLSETDSDFTDDSDYSTDNTDISRSSIDTCSTIAIISSTKTESTRIENKENDGRSLSEIQAVSPNSSYSLRPRKAITYTKNGIINESIHDFINQVKASESVSKTNRVRQLKNFLSSEED